MGEALHALLRPLAQLNQPILPVSRCASLHQPALAPLNDPACQAHEPELGNHPWQPHPCKPVSIRHAPPVEVNASTLPVAPDRLDPPAPLARMIGAPLGGPRGPAGAKERLAFIICVPPRQHRHRSVPLRGERPATHLDDSRPEPAPRGQRGAGRVRCGSHQRPTRPT